MKLVDQVQFNPDQAIRWGISLLGNGAGNMMNTTCQRWIRSQRTGNLFHCVLLCLLCPFFRKKKLHVQIRKVLFAFLPKQKADAFLKVCSLTYRTFANFLTGQCLEAVILGCMFVVTLSVLRMPLCTFDRSFDCIYSIDSYFWCFYRVCRRKFFNLYGKPEAGNYIHHSISGAAAD